MNPVFTTPKKVIVICNLHPDSTRLILKILSHHTFTLLTAAFNLLL